MDTHTAPLNTASALSSQRALGTGLLGKVDDATRYKRHLLCSRTADDLPFPIQSKGLLVKVCALANRPGFTIHLQVVAALAHQMATQVGPIDVQFFQSNRLPIQIQADRFGDTGFGRMAGVSPTARMRPLSKSWSTWRL